MVQVIENSTDIQCTVVDRTTSANVPGYDELTLRIDDAAPVADLADLISQRVGDTINLLVAHHLLPDGSLVGRQLRCRARMAGPGVYMAESDPPPERRPLVVPP
jgi:hypothetical protein